MYKLEVKIAIYFQKKLLVNSGFVVNCARQKTKLTVQDHAILKKVLKMFLKSTITLRMVIQLWQRKVPNFCDFNFRMTELFFIFTCNL